MRITITSVFVDDQESALALYTDVLGFQVKHNVPMGEHAWLTVVSPTAPDGPELLLEPAGPAAQFGVDDVDAEYAPHSAGSDVHATANRIRGPRHRCLRRHVRQPDHDPIRFGR